jgi:hypothetical protein
MQSLVPFSRFDVFSGSCVISSSFLSPISVHKLVCINGIFLRFPTKCCAIRRILPLNQILDTILPSIVSVQDNSFYSSILQLTFIVIIHTWLYR